MKSILYDFTPTELQTLLDTSDGYSDLLRKVELNPKGGNPKTLKKIIKEYELDETQLNINRSNLYSRCQKKTNEKSKIPLEDILNNKTEKPYGSSKLLKRLIKEEYKEYKCEICGLTEWQGKHITLQLDHIDGNHNNNSLDNLCILCPNCHSQTDTFAGKKCKSAMCIKKNNIKKIKKKIGKQISLPPIDRDKLKQLIRQTSFVEIGRRYGVTDNAVRKWCDKYKLPRKVSEIKKYTTEEWEDV